MSSQTDDEVDPEMRHRGKYIDLIDTDLWTFIERSEELFPPETAALPIDRQRALYDAMCRAFHQARPTVVETTDEALPPAARDVHLRRYRIAGRTHIAVALYFHGGGFVFGGLDSHDDICAELCAATGMEVFSGAWPY